MPSKRALIIGNTDYQDPKLLKLVAPRADVDRFAAVLRDAEVGAFDDVTQLVDEPHSLVTRAIGRFFSQRTSDDLLLLYFSGHGVRDDHGHLYLAVKDTECDLLQATAVASTFITAQMDRCLSRRQVLVLDCCHSGAFAEGAKAAVGESVGTGTAFKGAGYGRVILTASDSTQYAWEGDNIHGKSPTSLFTQHLIEGLRTGAADLDGDGWVGLDELYEYVYDRVTAAASKQTPGKWSYRQQGDIVIAKNGKPVPVALPTELVDALKSPFVMAREGAVRELARLLDSAHRGLRASALEQLGRLCEDDSRRVATLAEETLRGRSASNATVNVAEKGSVDGAITSHEDRPPAKVLRAGRMKAPAEPHDQSTQAKVVAPLAGAKQIPSQAQNPARPAPSSEVPRSSASDTPSISTSARPQTAQKPPPAVRVVLFGSLLALLAIPFLPPRVIAIHLLAPGGSRELRVKEGETVPLSIQEEHVRFVLPPSEPSRWEYSWSSTDPSVATVTGGYVAGVRQGSATVHASYNGKSDSVAVTVISRGNAHEVTGREVPK
jgi:uncharacterized caspase-like protein